MIYSLSTGCLHHRWGREKVDQAMDLILILVINYCETALRLDFKSRVRTISPSPSFRVAQRSLTRLSFRFLDSLPARFNPAHNTDSSTRYPLPDRSLSPNLVFLPPRHLPSRPSTTFPFASSNSSGNSRTIHHRFRVVRSEDQTLVLQAIDSLERTFSISSTTASPIKNGRRRGRLPPVTIAGGPARLFPSRELLPSVGRRLKVRI